MTDTSTSTATCPECDAVITREDGVMKSEILPCAECGAELEVTSLDPFKLSLAPEVEEDWGE